MDITEHQAELILDMMDTAYSEGQLHEDNEQLYRDIVAAYPSVKDNISWIWDEPRSSDSEWLSI